MGLWADFKHTVQHTYVADGVDLIDQTQNGSQQLFFPNPVNDEQEIELVDGSQKAKKVNIPYRNHWSTIVAHMFGLPTRQLTKKPTYTFKNFLRNWFGYNAASSTPARIGRGILMGVIVNPILLIPRAVVGIAKIVTEVIPGTISRFLLTQGENGVEFGKSAFAHAFTNQDNVPEEDPDRLSVLDRFGYGTLGAVGVLVGGAAWLVGAAVKSIYLTLCTLTSPIETVRWSYHTGQLPIAVPFSQYTTDNGRDERLYFPLQGKIRGVVLAGFAVVGSIITFALTGPFAIKALAAAFAPVAGGRISNAILSVEKIGNVKFIGPILTKIGEGFQKVISLPYISNALNFLRIGPTLQATPAAVIGLGAVVGGLISTVGTIINEFPYKKPWLRYWHNNKVNGGGDYVPLVAPVRADLGTGASSHVVRTADKTIGEGSGTKPLFASRAANGSVAKPQDEVQPTLVANTSYRSGQ